MAQSVQDIQAGIISLCRTFLVNQGNAVTANNAYKLDAQPFTFPTNATLASGPLSRKAAIAQEAAAQLALTLANSTTDPIKLNPTIAYKYLLATKEEVTTPATVKTAAQIKKESGVEARAELAKVLCYNCGLHGHYATSCRTKSSRHRSPSREKSRSRSRSRDHARSRSRSRTPPTKNRSKHASTSSSSSGKGKSKSSKKDWQALGPAGFIYPTTPQDVTREPDEQDVDQQIESFLVLDPDYEPYLSADSSVEARQDNTALSSSLESLLPLNKIVLKYFKPTTFIEDRQSGKGEEKTQKNRQSSLIPTVGGESSTDGVYIYIYTHRVCWSVPVWSPLYMGNLQPHTYILIYIYMWFVDPWSLLSVKTPRHGIYPDMSLVLDFYAYIAIYTFSFDENPPTNIGYTPICRWCLTPMHILRYIHMRFDENPPTNMGFIPSNLSLVFDFHENPPTNMGHIPICRWYLEKIIHFYAYIAIYTYSVWWYDVIPTFCGKLIFHWWGIYLYIYTSGVLICELDPHFLPGNLPRLEYIFIYIHFWCVDMCIYLYIYTSDVLIWNTIFGMIILSVGRYDVWSPCYMGNLPPHTCICIYIYIYLVGW